jgi:hypothetical protein
MSPNFVDAFLGGLSRGGGGAGGGSLLNSFLRREILQRQLKGLKDEEKQTETMVEVEMANLVETLQQQDGQLLPAQQEFQTALAPSLANAQVSTQEAQLRARPQARAAQAQRTLVSEEKRQQQRLVTEEERVEARRLKLETGARERMLARAQKNAKRAARNRANIAGLTDPDDIQQLEDTYFNSITQAIGITEAASLVAQVAPTDIDILTADLRRLQMQEVRQRLADTNKNRLVIEQFDVGGGRLSVRYSGGNGGAVLQADIKLHNKITQGLSQSTGDPYIAAPIVGVTNAMAIGVAFPLENRMRQALELILSNGGTVENLFTEEKIRPIISEAIILRLIERGIVKDRAELQAKGTELAPELQEEELALRHAAMFYVVENADRLITGAPAALPVTTQPVVSEAAPANKFDGVATESLFETQKAIRERKKTLESQAKRIERGLTTITPSRREGEGIGKRQPTAAERKKLSDLESKLDELDTELDEITREVLDRARKKARAAVPLPIKRVLVGG